MSGFARAHQQLLENHDKHLNRLNEARKDRERALNFTWSEHLECGEGDMPECIRLYDEGFLKAHKHLLHLTENTITCMESCEHIKKGTDIRQKVINMDGLKLVKDYIGCVSPCIERMILGTKAEIKIIHEHLDSIQSILKANKL